MADIAKLCAQDTALLSVQFPDLLGNSVLNISRQVHETGMVVGVFDKKLHVASGVCRKLLNTHLLMDVIFGDKFSIWGWGSAVRHAKVLAVKEIVRRARDGRVLAQACSLHLGHPDLLEPYQAERFFQSLLCTEDVSVHLAPPLCPPTLFSMLKWKSVEHGAEALLKWREVIAFCKVPLKRHARVIGRCLQVLVKLLYLDSTTIGFPLMLGTRDFGRACIHLSPDTSRVKVCEQDMHDMYWKIPKEEVLQSFTWAVSHMGTQRKCPITFFAVHRGGDKILDRLRKGAEDMFWNIRVSFVLQYVKWELFMNTVFTLGPLIVEQGKAGVPIGGCLSAPKSEMWAIWKEHTNLHGDTSSFQEAWQAEVNDQGFPDIQVVVPGPSQFTPLMGQGDFVRFEGIWAHSGRAFAPNKATQHVNTCPAAGFWVPSEQVIAWVSIARLEVPILYTTAWDGAALGRTESILRFSPKRDKRLLRDFFSQFTLADFVIHEVFSPPRHTACPIPCVLVARFKDNVPMAFVHVPVGMFETPKTILSTFLHSLYNIKLKWEPHDSVAQLCECEFDSSGPCFLLRKGVVRSLQSALRPDFDWQRWLPVTSPNARKVLRSTFPSLVHKSLLYCCSTQGLIANVRSLVWGAGWHCYPSDWWKKSVKGFLSELALTSTTNFADVDRWFLEGKEFKTRVGEDI